MPTTMARSTPHDSLVLELGASGSPLLDCGSASRAKVHEQRTNHAEVLHANHGGQVGHLNSICRKKSVPYLSTFIYNQGAHLQELDHFKLVHLHTGV